jgi:nucleotide-binding universal stress UspA family protein
VAEHAAASYLDGVAAGLSERAPLMQFAVTTGRPSELIPAYAEQHDVDLIAMSTHGRSGFACWYFGNVTTSVLRTSPTLLLLSKPHALHKQVHAVRTERSDEPQWTDGR